MTLLPVLSLLTLSACDTEGGGGEGADETGGQEDGSEGGSEGGGPGAEPDYNDFCQPQAMWDTSAAAFEAEVLEIVNQRRSEGATCGGETFGPTGPMVLDYQLRCAARMHSLDMDTRDFFDHTNPDGESPWDRIDKTDYSANATGENIAAGYPTPADVMVGWMDSPGHCSNIMNPNSNELGVGYYESYWTQVMGVR